MKIGISREDALKLLKEYNKEEFHIRHALTLESVMATLQKSTTRTM